jgi:hypothetical protein
MFCYWASVCGLFASREAHLTFEGPLLVAEKQSQRIQAEYLDAVRRDLAAPIGLLGNANGLLAPDRLTSNVKRQYVILQQCSSGHWRSLFGWSVTST